MSNNITNASDANFKKEVIESNMPVFVDFFASWCGPCKYFANVLNEVAPLYSEKVKFVKVNVDECPEVAAQAGILFGPDANVLQKRKNRKIHVRRASERRFYKGNR